MPYLISLAVLGAIIYAYYQYATAPREWLKTLRRRRKCKDCHLTTQTA